MKKHLFIWIPGVLSVLTFAIADAFNSDPPLTTNAHAVAIFAYVITFILELIMAYGCFLLLGEKHRSSLWIALPIFVGVLGAAIVYLIPKKKDTDPLRSSIPEQNQPPQINST